MKLLYITTVGMTMRFFQPLIQELLNSNNTVDIACNEATSKIPDCYRQWGCTTFPISWERSPFSCGNLKAIKQIQNIVGVGHYDIVHCHTPIAAACTRIACRKVRKNGVKIIYTAHGFHFYKGAPLKNWLIYYPIEKVCSRWTDVLITINKEDYTLAKKRMKSKKIEYVPGVGIDTKKFKSTVVDKNRKREEIGIPQNAFLVLSVGELNENKNHQIVVRAIAEIGKNIHYAIAGKGDQNEALKKMAAELGISEQLHLLGYRSDVAELYKTADVYVLPSIREGLNVSVMEAMASGVPCIVSEIRGNVDMVQDGVNGYYINPFKISAVVESIKKAVAAPKKADIPKYADKFNETETNKKILEIYENCL